MSAFQFLPSKPWGGVSKDIVWSHRPSANLTLARFSRLLAFCRFIDVPFPCIGDPDPTGILTVGPGTLSPAPDPRNIQPGAEVMDKNTSRGLQGKGKQENKSVRKGKFTCRLEREGKGGTRIGEGKQWGILTRQHGTWSLRRGQRFRNMMGCSPCFWTLCP